MNNGINHIAKNSSSSNKDKILGNKYMTNFRESKERDRGVNFELTNCNFHEGTLKLKKEGNHSKNLSLLNINNTISKNILKRKAEAVINKKPNEINSKKVNRIYSPQESQICLNKSRSRSKENLNEPPRQTEGSSISYNLKNSNNQKLSRNNPILIANKLNSRSKSNDKDIANTSNSSGLNNNLYTTLKQNRASPTFHQTINSAKVQQNDINNLETEKNSDVKDSSKSSYSKIDVGKYNQFTQYKLKKVFEMLDEILNYPPNVGLTGDIVEEIQNYFLSRVKSNENKAVLSKPNDRKPEEKAERRFMEHDSYNFSLRNLLSDNLVYKNEQNHSLVKNQSNKDMKKRPLEKLDTSGISFKRIPQKNCSPIRDNENNSEQLSPCFAAAREDEPKIETRKYTNTHLIPTNSNDQLMNDPMDESLAEQTSRRNSTKTVSKTKQIKCKITDLEKKLEVISNENKELKMILSNNTNDYNAFMSLVNKIQRDVTDIKNLRSSERITDKSSDGIEVQSLFPGTEEESSHFSELNYRSSKV